MSTGVTAQSGVTSAPSPQSGLTSIVIVAANSGDGLVKCVTALIGGLDRGEIIVVDNDSHDGSIDRLATMLAQNPLLRVLRNGANLGFGTGCNRGAALARGDAILFLNPDCVLMPSSLSLLRALLDAQPDVGLVGALQIDAAGRVDPASRRRDPLLRRALLTATGLSRFMPALESVELALPVGEGSESVDAVSGALMLVRRTAFFKIGGFDEGYFLHCEDLDLCRRIRDAGYRVVCDNQVRVEHAKGGSSRSRPLFVAWHKHRGMWRWFTKFDPAARNPLLKAMVWSGIWTAFALKLPLLATRRAFRAHATH